MNFGCDLTETIAGRGHAPSLVLTLIKALPDTSNFHASIAGGREFVGWGRDRHMLADLLDYVSFNTRATGNWSEPPDIPEYPRPRIRVEEADEKQVPRLRQLWTMLNRGGK